MPERQETWAPTGPVKRKSQFSIRNLFLWTTIVSVGVVITTATLTEVGQYEEVGILIAITNLSIYLMMVCGLWTLIKNPKSFDFWFPAGVSVSLPVFILLCSVGILMIPGQNGDLLLEGISLVILCLGVPYGIGLLALIAHSTSKWGFSLAMLVFCVGCWLWWMACAAIVWLGASGAVL